MFRDAALVPRFAPRRVPRRASRGDPAASIEGYRFPDPAAAFVVRVPAVPGARLVFDAGAGPGGGAAFDLDALAAPAASLPLAKIGEMPLQKIGKAASGSPGNRVDLVILGDGYTAAQAAEFAPTPRISRREFFSITPYASTRLHRRHRPLHRLRPGRGRPPALPRGLRGDDRSCCADPDMQADPLRGTFVSTAFGGRFCSFNIHRLAVVDNATVLAAASAVPDWDRLFVLIHDPTYGGSGGASR